jgi:hypothetical protein
MANWVCCLTNLLIVLTLLVAVVGPAFGVCVFGPCREGLSVTDKREYPSACPASHPYAFNGQGVRGGFCCRTPNIKKSIVPQDYADTCADDNYIQCGQPPCAPHPGVHEQASVP